MPAKTSEKSATSARPSGKKNAPVPAPAPVSKRATSHRPQGEKSPPSGDGTPALPSSVESAEDRGIRTSVSLYEADLNELEPLRVYLRQQTGLRVIKDSSLVQTVCRTVRPGPEHVAALRAVLEVTGRKYRK